MIFAINCGHTIKGAGYGAVGILNESDETRRLGYMVMKLLKDMGHSVIDCTVDKADTQQKYLEKAVDIANSQKVDIFLSIHFDSFNTQAEGTTIFTCNGVKHVEAQRILNNITQLGFRNRGIKEANNLYVVKNTEAKALLLEVCFCDNLYDTTLYKKNVEKIAKAIVEGLTGEKVIDMNNVCSNKAFEESRQRLMKLGITDGTNPKNPVTREQVWSMIDRALKAIGQ